MINKYIKKYLNSINFPKYRIFDYNYKCCGGRVDLITIEEDKYKFINFISKSLAEELAALDKGVEEYCKLKGINISVETAFLVEDNGKFRIINAPLDNYYRHRI